MRLPYCPKCKGVWLDPGEIDAIKEAVKSEGIAIGMLF
jgi:Zn-finger nucleic acid-binding protein